MSLEEAYRSLAKYLSDYRNTHFPRGATVRVEHERFHGWGVVEYDERCPPDRIAVLLENGNVWWYETETVTVVPARSCPPYIRLLKLKNAGIQCAASVHGR